MPFLVAAPVFFGGFVEATASGAGFVSIGLGVVSSLGFGVVASFGIGLAGAAATWVEGTEGLVTAAGPAAIGWSMASMLNPTFCASAPTNF